MNGIEYKIDEESAGLKLSVNCDFPCKTCTSGKAICDTCLTTLTGAQLLK